MTSTLRVTDGTTTVTLTEGDMYLAKYVPQTATDMNAPIKEKAQVRFTKNNSTIRDNVNDLNRLLYQASAYQSSKTGPRVYVEFDPGDTGDFYRSLLYTGAAHPMENLLGAEWRNNNVGMDLEWSRQPFWEGPLTQIPLTNSSATDDLNGITVDNANYSNTAGTYENWVSIDAADILGDLPAPIKVQMVNATSGADPTDEIYIFHNVYSNPASLTHIIEGESSASATVTPTADATSSDGSYGEITWAPNTETMIAAYDLTAANLGYAAGGKFAILARWSGLFPYDDCWLRLRLETTTNFYDIKRGNLALGSTIVDGRELAWLDTMRLPPYLEGQTALRELALRLYGKCTGSSKTINLDYLQLSPISGEAGWLRFKSVARGVPYNQTFVHDETDEVTYRIDGSSNLIGEFSQYGGPILLTPKKDQRLYFNTCDYLGYAKITQTWTVKLWYRPRRNAI